MLVQVGCKVVHVLATYLTLCSYCWMFCEGLYLYMNLVFAFINAKKVLVACIIIGWGITPPPPHPPIFLNLLSPMTHF